MIQGIADGFGRERFIKVICSGITLFSELGKNKSQRQAKTQMYLAQVIGTNKLFVVCLILSPVIFLPYH